MDGSGIVWVFAFTVLGSVCKFWSLISEMCLMSNQSNEAGKMNCYELLLTFDNFNEVGSYGVGCVTIYSSTSRTAVVLDLSVPQIHRSC
jgi:hypothetical protein